ncbi:MAG: hypothetical protein JO222_14065 [Frankiales bacterium]|nr:hypothetical protein [Frankiales bacterium]
MRRSFMTIAAVLTSVLTLSASAHAAPAGYGDKPPVVGKWKLIGYGGGGPSFVKGGFTVTAHHKAVRAFVATPTSDAAEQCGGQTPVSLAGKQKIRHFHGINLHGNHYSVWTVGKEDPKVPGQVQPIKVPLKRAGQSLTGRMMLTFHNPRGGRPHNYGPPKSEGSLSYKLPGQPRCALSFLFKKT